MKTKKKLNLISIIVEDTIASDSVVLTLAKPVTRKSLVCHIESCKGKGYLKNKTLFSAGKEVSHLIVCLGLRLKTGV